MAWFWFQNNKHVVTEIGPAVRTTQVAMQGNRFFPNHVQVHAGETVTWSNAEAVRHNVVYKRSVLPASPYLEGGETFATTFTSPGVYDYACSLHAGMIGTVTVIRVTD